jgi:uncharacterized membrane protein
MRTRSIWTYLYLTAGFGLLVAIYAGIETLDPSLRSSCTVSSYFSCSAVDASQYTTTLGIPDAAIGITGFIVILGVAAFAERHTADLRSFYALLFVTTAGVAVAAYFAYVEVALIHALCPVCTTAYIFSVLVWIGAIALTMRMRGEAKSAPAEAPGSPA